MRKTTATMMAIIATLSLTPAAHADDQDLFDSRVRVINSRTCADDQFDAEISGVTTRAEAYQMIKTSFGTEDFSEKELRKLASLTADHFVACGAVSFPFSEKVMKFFGSDGQKMGSSAFSS